jgi:hypothetical protein
MKGIFPQITKYQIFCFVVVGFLKFKFQFENSNLQKNSYCHLFITEK